MCVYNINLLVSILVIFKVSITRPSLVCVMLNFYFLVNLGLSPLEDRWSLRVMIKSFKSCIYAVTKPTRRTSWLLLVGITTVTYRCDPRFWARISISHMITELENLARKKIVSADALKMIDVKMLPGKSWLQSIPERNRVIKAVDKV